MFSCLSLHCARSLPSLLFLCLKALHCVGWNPVALGQNPIVLALDSGQLSFHPSLSGLGSRHVVKELQGRSGQPLASQTQKSCCFSSTHTKCQVLYQGSCMLSHLVSPQHCCQVIIVFKGQVENQELGNSKKLA